MSNNQKLNPAVSLSITAAMFVSLYIMIKSFDSGETWRIIASSIGFLCFFSLGMFFLYSQLKNKKK